MAKGPNPSFKIWYGLTVHILFASKIYKQNFQNYLPSQIPANYANAVQFAHTVCEFRKNLHILLTYSTLCFRHPPQQRTLRNSSELRKFHAIRPHSPRILQNSHILLTYSTLCFRHLPQQRMLRNSSELRKFRAVRPHSLRITRNLHQLLTLHLAFQMPDQWQRTP